MYDGMCFATMSMNSYEYHEETPSEKMAHELKTLETTIYQYVNEDLLPQTIKPQVVPISLKIVRALIRLTKWIFRI